VVEGVGPNFRLAVSYTVGIEIILMKHPLPLRIRSEWDNCQVLFSSREAVKVFIHIGPHKTGTTYIQRECAERRQELLDIGIFYPKTWNNFLFGHTGIYHQLRQKHFEHFRQTYEKMIEETPSASLSILLSNENLEDLEEDGIRALAKNFSAHDVKIVYHVREWTALLTSTWQENVKHGSRDTLAEYAYSHCVSPATSPMFNYNLVIDRYASTFGAENIIIRVYDNILAAQGDLLEDLLDVIHGPGTALKGRGQRINASLIPMETEIVRLLNVMTKSQFDRNPGVDTRTAYFAVRPTLAAEREELSRRCARVIKEFPTHDFPLAFGRVEKELMLKYKNLGPGVEGRIFVEQKSKPVRFLSTDFLLDDECRAIFMKVAERVWENMGIASREPRGA
jgi:hypothetical protein